MQIPVPNDMDLPTWANLTVSALHLYTSMSQFTPGVTDWQQWGMQFFNNPQLGLLDPPNPYAYDKSDWMLWAQRLYDAMGQATGGSSTTPGGGGGSGGGGGFGNAIVTQLLQGITTQLGEQLVTQ